jgi:hypothetical protein
MPSAFNVCVCGCSHLLLKNRNDNCYFKACDKDDIWKVKCWEAVTEYLVDPWLIITISIGTISRRNVALRHDHDVWSGHDTNVWWSFLLWLCAQRLNQRYASGLQTVLIMHPYISKNKRHAPTIYIFIYKYWFLNLLGGTCSTHERR